MARDRATLERITLLQDHVGWKTLREECLLKLERMEGTLNRLLFKTRTEVNPVEIEYYRGFRQGVMYVLDGLPNTIMAEFERELARDKDGEV